MRENYRDYYNKEADYNIIRTLCEVIILTNFLDILNSIIFLHLRLSLITFGLSNFMLFGFASSLDKKYGLTIRHKYNNCSGNFNASWPNLNPRHWSLPPLPFFLEFELIKCSFCTSTTLTTTLAWNPQSDMSPWYSLYIIIVQSVPACSSIKGRTSNSSKLHSA